MKKLLLLVAIATVSIVFNSCAEEPAEPELDRDKFLGSWSGTLEFKTYFDGVLISELSGNEEYVSINITADAADDYIYVDDDILCSVDGRMFNLYLQNNVYADGVTYTVTECSGVHSGTNGMDYKLVLSTELEGVEVSIKGFGVLYN